MTMNSSPDPAPPRSDFGEVLLSSTFRPVHAVNILITGALFLFLAIDGIYFNLIVPDAANGMIRGALGVVLGIGTLATIKGISQLVRPQALVDATDRGLVLHRPAGAVRAPGDPECALVPWSQVKSLEFKVLALPTGLRKARLETIALRIHGDGGFRIPDGFSQVVKDLPGCDPEAVYIDAATGQPGGRELLHRLEELRQESDIASDSAG